MSDHPFGFDTLTIPAVLVVEGDHDAAQAAAETVGFDAVRLPAVLVPAGGAPPAGDYVMLGMMTQAATGGGAAAAPPVAAVGASVGAAADATVEASREAQPTTRHRTAGGQPPTPGSARDPVAVGVAAWRGMRRRPGHAATGNPPAPE